MAVQDVAEASSFIPHSALYPTRHLERGRSTRKPPSQRETINQKAYSLDRELHQRPPQRSPYQPPKEPRAQLKSPQIGWEKWRTVQCTPSIASICRHKTSRRSNDERREPTRAVTTDDERSETTRKKTAFHLPNTNKTMPPKKHNRRASRCVGKAQWLQQTHPSPLPAEMVPWDGQEWSRLLH